jgi:hypothetical protein
VLTFKKTRLSVLLLPGILLLAAIAGPCLQPPLVALPKHEPCCGSIAPAGDHLASVLDDMNVESLWIAGQHINWETGEPDRGGDYEGPGNHTHCSAFSAAVAKRLGIYLLRPPEHGQSLLANAQSKWLETAAAEKEAIRASWWLSSTPIPIRTFRGTSPSCAPQRNLCTRSKTMDRRSSRRAPTITTAPMYALGSAIILARGRMVCRIMRIRSVRENLPRVRANGTLLARTNCGLALLTSGVDWAETGISGDSVPETWPG